MGRKTTTQKQLARNKAEKQIRKLQIAGKPVPADLLSKVNWGRKIVRGII